MPCDHKNGFYVRAMPNKCNPSQVIKYIGRCLGRPVIATSRIDSYDGESVTFHYNRHEDEKLVTETIPVLDFMARLTQHIPEKHFKMIRYYGIYARHRKSDRYLHRAISKEKHKIFLSFNRWRDSILLSFGYDPLKCPSCVRPCCFLNYISTLEPVPLHELYEGTMRKHRAGPLPLFFSSIVSCCMVQSRYLIQKTEVQYENESLRQNLGKNFGNSI